MPTSYQLHLKLPCSWFVVHSPHICYPHGPIAHININEGEGLQRRRKHNNEKNIAAHLPQVPDLATVLPLPVPGDNYHSRQATAPVYLAGCALLLYSA